MLPGAQRMVVGHTIQDAGINSACDGRVVRIDVGLSAGCGDGDPQVREGLGSLGSVFDGCGVLCGGRAVRIDVRLSAGCGDGDPQVREV